jgi:predicted GNAT family N-acyltransferase
MSFETHLLNKKYQRDSFMCEQPSLTTYLKEQASQDIKKKMALCFVAIDAKYQIIGYYTLSNASISKAVVPEEIQKKLGYKDIPVTLLGRLARDQNHKGQGLGELLLMDALHRSVDASRNQTTSYAVVTDPIDDYAEKFYSKYGFQKLADSQRMFLPMKTIEGLF